MRALILSSLLSLSSTGVWANQCEVNIEGQLKIEKQTLTIETLQHDKVVIDRTNTLWVNGRQVHLSSHQQKLVSAYYAGIYTAAPQAAAIATDAIKLASVAVNGVFVDLLGHDDQAIADLTDKLDELGEKINNNFYAEDGELRFYSSDFNDGDFVEQQWKDDFEQTIEEIVTQNIGRLIMNIGSELLFGDGDMSAFEAKMERFGQEIEDNIEHQSAEIEARADSLCQSLVLVDHVENQLQQVVPQLSDLNVIHVEETNQAM